MYSLRVFVLILVCTTTVCGTASSCAIGRDRNLNHVKLADAVVVGRILNYRIIENVEMREKTRKARERYRDSLPPELKETYDIDAGYMSDYARFDIQVNEVMKGNVDSVLTVTWDNSTYGEPKSMPSNPFVIALRDPTSPLPPFVSPITANRNPEPEHWTVLQAACSPAFIFDQTSDVAAQVRQILLDERE